MEWISTTLCFWDCDRPGGETFLYKDLGTGFCSCPIMLPNPILWPFAKGDEDADIGLQGGGEQLIPIALFGKSKFSS